MHDDDTLRQLEQAAAPTLDPAEAAALAVASTWVGDAVHGVGIGRTDDDRPCVVVVADPSRPTAVDELPDEVEGLPVVVHASGALVAYDQEPPDDQAITATP